MLVLQSEILLEGCIDSHRGVAQPGRALRSGRRGRWFKSSRPDWTYDDGSPKNCTVIAQKRAQQAATCGLQAPVSQLADFSHGRLVVRQPKPFFRKFTKTWYVTLNGKQINLGPVKDEAFQKYHELMAKRGRATHSYATVAHLFDAYLEWLSEHRSPSTYDKAVHYLNSLARFLDKRITIERLEPGMLLEWVESETTWMDSTSNDAISIVQRAFNWGVKRGHITRSPVANVEGKPRKGRRETVFAPAEWSELRDLVQDEQFGDLLDFMWATGCRPIEARTVEARHVDLENRLVLFPPSEAKGRKNERVIFLTEIAFDICAKLVELHAHGPIFRNTRGRAWACRASE